MRSRALQMSTAASLFLAAVPMAVMLGRTLRLSHSADGVDWPATSSPAVEEPTARPARRVAVAPTPTGRRSKLGSRADRDKAAAILLLVMLGGNRFAVASR